MHTKFCIRFEVFMAVEVLGVVTPCSVVVGYHFRGPSCLHLADEVNGTGEMACI